MPAHNTAAYIGGAIESALAQTRADLELIVVDDGSTDLTAAICREHIRRDRRVRLVQQPNRGPSAARNAAFACARAPVFALLDSDDLWLPTFLERQLALLDSETAIVTANAWSLGGTLHGTLQLPDVGEVRRLALGDILREERAVCIMSIFRREVVEHIGGFDEALWSNEDYDFWLRAALAGFSIVQNPEPLGWYRRREGSNSSGDIRMLRGILSVLKRARARCAERPHERAIADAQIERFTRELVAAEGKGALAERDYARAARRFGRLARLDRTVKSTLIAAAIRYCPAAVTWALHARARLRPLTSRAT